MLTISDFGTPNPDPHILENTLVNTSTFGSVLIHIFKTKDLLVIFAKDKYTDELV